MINSNEFSKIFDHFVSFRPVDDLKPGASDPRTHNPIQNRQSAANISAFGYSVPVFVDATSTILAGHARLEAARRFGMDGAPVVQIDHPTRAQNCADVIADNRLAGPAGWGIYDNTRHAGLDVGF